MSRKRRKLNDSPLGVTDKWLVVLATVNGTGSSVLPFETNAILEPCCHAMVPLATMARPLALKQWRLRLLKLLGCTAEVFRRITDLGVVAGGAVVYALNDFVPVNAVADVDIFILRGDTQHWVDLQHILTTDLNCSETDRRMYLYRARHAQPEEKDLEMERIQFQNPFGKQIDLIRATYATHSPMALVRDFDFDYSRCYFHRGVFSGTRAAQVAHRTRTVRVHNSRIPSPVPPESEYICCEKRVTDQRRNEKLNKRIVKIRDKGFRVDNWGEVNAPPALFCDSEKDQIMKNNDV